MSDNWKEYRGEKILIRYHQKRCIHASECVHAMREVFNPDRKPWINADAGDADKIEKVIRHCPTGALQYERLDGAKAEPIPKVNTITLVENGPLYCTGNIVLQTSEGEELWRETRVALCRCGASSIKPYCDSSHKQLEFEHDGDIAQHEKEKRESLEAESGELIVRATDNGPLIVKGPFVLVNAKGETVSVRNRAGLCRCGTSGNKPFCDGSHKDIEFNATLC